MVKQEQLSDEDKQEKKESYSVKSKIVKLFFILLLGGAACWFYINPDVLKNIKGYFIHMAERTGTLWEKAETTNSCNHGFASAVLYWLKGMDNV